MKTISVLVEECHASRLSQEAQIHLNPKPQTTLNPKPQTKPLTRHDRHKRKLMMS
jgi:hypothetical protein